jgi:septal ring factor EnvC (AmiA/AmiB activator)
MKIPSPISGRFPNNPKDVGKAYIWYLLKLNTASQKQSDEIRKELKERNEKIAKLEAENTQLRKEIDALDVEIKVLETRYEKAVREVEKCEAGKG